MTKVMIYHSHLTMSSNKINFGKILYGDILYLTLDSYQHHLIRTLMLVKLNLSINNLLMTCSSLWLMTIPSLPQLIIAIIIMNLEDLSPLM